MDGCGRLKALVRFTTYLTIHTTSYIKDLEVILTSKYEGEEMHAFTAFLKDRYFSEEGPEPDDD